MLLKWTKNRKAYAAVLIAVFIWGLFPSIAKIALNTLDVSSFIAVRFFFSSILLAHFSIGIMRKRQEIPVKLWLAFTCIVGVLFFSQTLAISLIPVSWYIIIFSITPVIMAIFLRYTLQWQAIAGILIVVISLFLFLSEKQQQSLHFFPIFIMILGMFSWIFYSVLIKKFHSVYSDVQITALTCYFGAIINVGGLFFHSNVLSRWTIYSISLAGITGIILVAAFFCYSYGLRHQPKFSIFGQYLEPVFGLTTAAFLFGNILTMKQFIATFFILAGTLIATRYSREGK